MQLNIPTALLPILVNEVTAPEIKATVTRVVRLHQLKDLKLKILKNPSNPST